MSIVCAVVATAIFLFDLSLPLGVAGGVPYVALVLLGMWAPSRPYIFLLAVVGSGLTIVGYLFSDNGGVSWVVLINRGLAFFVIWSTAILVAHRNQSRDALEQSNNELEKSVEQRTREFRESESRYRALSDLTSEGVAIVKDSIIIEANQAFADMYGYEVSELVGKPTLELTVPELRSDVAGRLEENLSDSYESESFRKDGSRIPIEIKAAPIIYQGQKMRVSRLRDLTETRLAAATIRDSDERYKNITDNLPVLIAYIDRDRRYRSVNKLFETWYQLPVSEIVGQRMEDIMLPDSYAKMEPSINRVLAGEAVMQEDASLTPDGIYRYRRVNYIPHRGEDGSVMGFFALVEDISDLRRTMQELELQRERLAEAQRIGNIGNWERNFETEELSWSTQAYRIFGLTDANSVPPSREQFLSLVHEADRSFVQAALVAAVEIDVPYRLDHRIVRPDGTIRILHEEAVVIRDAAGQPLRMAGTCQDITEQKQIEEQLRRAQRLEAVGQLTGGVAHDFNNILAAIIGNLDLIEDRADMAASDRDSIAIALGAANRGAELTHRLLAFSRQQPLNAVITDINEVVRNFQKFAKPVIGEDITVELTLAADIWPVVVDIGQLENALLNLIINARDATPDGGRLTIETANRFLDGGETEIFEDLSPGDYAMVAVTDNGIGMSADILKQAVEPFFTTKDVGKGSGLGLSMVFGFARQSDGQVSIDSEEKNGTTVRIFLPKAEVVMETTAATETAEELDLNGSETILVVEDNRDVLDYLVKSIERHGYAVLQAEDGPTAVALMANCNGIDLLLTDVVLPHGMSGRDVASAFKERYPAAGILYSSGYTQDVLNSRGQLEDGVALISKPYRSRDLIRRVRELLDG
ncbi:MAG: PAS domain S-box protein [Rhodospirillaceae bacterium]|nr:PAS domain S-box protein [Rhodospirillaceae bacterium]MBT5191836.1 PAS domain S-box protein [Rhodospirillaceae bacterium]